MSVFVKDSASEWIVTTATIVSSLAARAPQFCSENYPFFDYANPEENELIKWRIKRIISMNGNKA